MNDYPLYLLLTFLSLYGTQSRDLQPAFPTFFQPHGQQTAFEFDNLSRFDTVNYDWTWQWQDREYNGAFLPLNQMLPMTCEGAFPMTLTATDKATQATFSRTECVWVVWSYYDFPPCQSECTIIDAGGVVIYEPFDPYQYRVNCGLDANCNGIYDAEDLLTILSQLN